jgi:outer membrane lipoprotein-sorting protein
MYKYLAWALTAFLFPISAALSAVISPEELSKRLQFYRSISSLKVDFKQLKTLNDLHVKLESQGHLKLVQPDQVIWEILKPSRVQIQLNKNELQIASGEGAERSVQTLKIDDMPEGKDSRSIAGLMAWLQLDAHVLSERYLVSSVGTSKLEFVPKDVKQSVFSRIEMSLSSSGHLESLHILETSGDEIDIRFGVPIIETKKKGS